MDDVIIVGSLSDKELKSSIDALVTYVDNSTKSMAKSFDSAITSMKNSLKGVKDATIAYDQLAAAKQKAMQNKSAEESFYTFIQKYRENAAKLANELKVMPSQSLDRQVQEYQRFEQEINNVKRKIQELRTQLNEVGRNPNASRWEVKAITDQIALYEKEIKQLTSEQLASTKKIEQADNAAMAKKRAMYEETKKLIRELTVEERKATDAAKTISNAHQQTQAAISGGVKKSSATEESESIRILRERIKEQELLRESMARGSVELAKQNEIIADLKRQLKEELMTQEEKRKAIEKQNDALERQKAKQLKQSQSDYIYNFNKANTESSKTIDAAEQKLRNLKRAVDDMRKSGLFDDVKLNKAQKAIDTLEQKIERMRSKKPMTMQDVLGMDESSIDAITRKMSALKRVSIDPNNAEQVKKLGTEYQRLSRLQSDLLGRNAQAIRSNNMLAQSFGYIRNRIVYALTLGALSNFTKQIYEVRGQYELLERSLGVLVNSYERGSEIFNELNEMAIKSPFTLIELGTAAKQLTAYNFSADEVVDTTRRLADISAALGVSMERLTYNLGQIKAQGVLNARDARDFANAGLAIVPMLAQMYTEQKRFGDQVVTTAQVYDMMSKKMVSYSDVLQVLFKITDEGGKFFDFQAKQAETLKVQMNNLTLAMNNMYNEIGASNQGLLVGTVQTLKRIFENWRQVARGIETVVLALGTYKAVSVIATSVAPWLSLARGIRSAKDAMALFNLTVKANPLGLLASLLASVIGYFVLFKNDVSEATQDVVLFGDSGARALKKIDTFQKILEGTSETSSTYKKTLSELSTITDEYGVQLDKENAKRSDINSAIEQTIELIKKESAERQRANQLEKAQETYNTQSENARKELQERLKSAMTGTNLGLFTWKSDSKELQENAAAISEIVASIVESNITLIAGKTGEEYQKGLDEIFSLIQDRMKAIGLSESTVSKKWLSSALFSGTNIINEYIDKINEAKNAQDTYNEKIEKNYEIAKKVTQSTMTYTEKIDANARALRNNANDAVSLYNKIYDIVKIAQQNHVINFDLKLTAQKPPQWMQNIDLPELQRLAARFTAVAQAGGYIKGYTRETTYEQGLLYASAAREKQYKDERKALEERNKANNKTKKTGGTKKDPLADSLKEEIELIDNIQKRYNEYLKIGVSTQEAITKAAEGYNATLTRVNATLSKYGIQTKNANELANMDLRGVRDYYESLLDVAKGAKNTKGIESLEKAINKINDEITKMDYKKITDGLNNELGKLKDEYELSIELDANPELGDMFSSMFGIDTDTLPRTFSDAINRAQTLINQKLSELNITSPFDIMETDVERFATAANLDKESAAIKELAKWQNTFRDMFKKNLVESEKLLDDYVKKYGGYSDKIAEIEADRLEKIKKLNDAYYTEEMRQRPEYIAKINAINQGANREKSNVEFEAFKDSRYYTMMFENLDYVSTKTIRDMRDRLRELMDSMKDLTPEQLKQVMSQYEKLEQKLTKRSPFKTLSKDLKEYFKTSKDRKAANEAFRNAQKEYDAQEKNVAALKEKYEQAKASDDTSQSYLNSLQAEVIAQDEILKKLKEQLDAAQKKADKYNLIKKLTSEELLAATQMVTANLSSLGELRDQINALFGVDGSKGETLFGFEADAVIDNLTKVGNEISKIISSAQSGNVVGVVSGVIGTVSGIGDAIASVFGDGAARTKRINKEINKSKESVRLLKMAYEDLERAVDKSLGTAETEARRSAIANKEAELAELERQMTLEQSKRSKDRDDDTIKEYQETIHSLRNEIEDLKEDVVNNLLGSDVKSAAEEFVDTWVEAWRAGETTLDAIQEKMDDMILNLIKKAMTSKIVETLLNPIYSELDRMTTDSSEGGVALTTNELRQLATQAGVTAGEINTALGEFYGNLANLGIISPTENERELSALQQGIQGITEDTAGALEAYMNGVSQQVYLHSDLLTQIRDAVVGFDLDVQTATVSQILLQLQSSYQVQMSIQSILNGWSNPNGMAVRVEMVS